MFGVQGDSCTGFVSRAEYLGVFIFNKMKKKYYSKSESRHMCLCIDGALSSRKKIKYMSDDNGNPVTDKEARNYLKSLKSQGYEVMMMGDCYRFDKVKGCKGHIKSLKPCDYDGMRDKIELEWQLYKQGKRL